jgi:hypothetical protein
VRQSLAIAVKKWFWGYLFPGINLFMFARHKKKGHLITGNPASSLKLVVFRPRLAAGLTFSLDLRDLIRLWRNSQVKKNHE